MTYEPNPPERCVYCGVLRTNVYPRGRYYSICPMNFGNAHLWKRGFRSYREAAAWYDANRPLEREDAA